MVSPSMRGRTAKKEVGEKGAGGGRRRGGGWEEVGGRWETEGREEGEEKFVKWGEN